MAGGGFYSLYTDDRDEKIAELEEEVERLRGAASEAGIMIDSNSVTTNVNTITQMQREIDFLESALRNQRNKYTLLEDEIDFVKETNLALNQALDKSGAAERDHCKVESLQKQLDIKDEELHSARQLILEMQKIGYANLPAKVVEESKKAAAQIDASRKQQEAAFKSEMEAKAKLGELEGKLKAVNRANEGDKKVIVDLQTKIRNVGKEKEEALKALNEQWEQKENRRVADDKRMIELLEYQITQLKVQASTGVAAPAPSRAKSVKVSKDLPGGAPAADGANTEALQIHINTLKKQNAELMEKLKASVESSGPRMSMINNKELQNQAKFYKTKLEDKDKEIEKLQREVKRAKETAETAAQNSTKVKDLEEKLRKLEKEKSSIAENYRSEMLLRKKYFNMVEDMKGKIRVYCRVRPIVKHETDKGHKVVVDIPDEFTISVPTARGAREFQFDRVFKTNSSQEEVFDDTNHLIQSAIDGYNVCIFAYGQTGSGKTHTLIGNVDAGLAGVAPRAFTKMFQLINAPINQKQFTFTVQAYMMELYNDKLLDLLKKGAEYSEKMEIKKDEKGMVYIPGATLKNANSAKELQSIFEEGIQCRHVASTKMNSESSRSHLVISIVCESVNKTNKQVIRGKLSIIDLAGSERLSKSGATGENLKEANSINMSLSALGDVIAALTSEQTFVPYRNNKLTMLMQDSLGGNAKTLMFVNASPVDFNTNETINSLSYASRVKLIKNDASKNKDSEEVAKLRKELARLRAG